MLYHLVRGEESNIHKLCKTSLLLKKKNNNNQWQ